MLQTRYDPELGIVRLSGKGFFSLEDEQEAANSAREAIAACRKIHGDVKILVECDSQVQRPEVLAAAFQRCDQLERPHDRVAFLFESSLAKLQAGRFFNIANRQCFISEGAAITWLLADRGSARLAS